MDKHLTDIEEYVGNQKNNSYSKKKILTLCRGEYLKGSLLCNFQPRATKVEREEETPHSL